MNILKTLFNKLKNIFFKQNNIKKIEAPSNVDLPKDNKSTFINSLKVNNFNYNKKNSIQTLICDGDGTGIQGNLKS